jgi:hypothetical protein
MTEKVLAVFEAGVPHGPGGSEGQFCGQACSEHFVSRYDETKWCAFRASFCR